MTKEYMTLPLVPIMNWPTFKSIYLHVLSNERGKSFLDAFIKNRVYPIRMAPLETTDNLDILDILTS